MLSTRSGNVFPFVVLLGAFGCGRAGSHEPEKRTEPSARPPSTLVTEAPPAPAQAAAPQAPAPTANEGPLRVLVAGDVIAHRPVLIEEGALRAALGPLDTLFGAADAVLVNHESSTGDAPGGKRSDLLYAAPASWAKELSASHVSAIGLANNHACDLGRQGLFATLASAKEAGLRHFGAGEDPWKAEPIASRGGHTVCAVGWSTLTNGDPMACDKSLAFAPESPTAEARVAKAIAEGKTHGCDAVIAVVHIGEEYKDQPPSVFALGERLADAGADAVVMHHPHVPSLPKAARTRDGRVVPVFPSLGNLVSNQGYAWRAPKPVVVSDRRQVSANAWTRVGLVADLAFTFTEGKPKVSGFGYHVIWNERKPTEIKGKSTIVARVLGRDDRDLLARFAADPDGPNAIFGSACWRDNHDTAPSDTACATPHASEPVKRTARGGKKR
ncbi:MAG: CapA family protein [Myxococcales bacterium]|nr:CapA family protein [Myxococcales bacterium]